MPVEGVASEEELVDRAVRELGVGVGVVLGVGGAAGYVGNTLG